MDSRIQCFKKIRELLEAILGTVEGQRTVALKLRPQEPAKEKNTWLRNRQLRSVTVTGALGNMPILATTDGAVKFE